MSTMQRFIRASLVLAAALAVSGSAFARRPPALERLQEAASRIIDTCPQSPSGPGYRDSLARFRGNAASASPSSLAVSAIQKRMDEHVVIICPAGKLHTSGGYRDMLVRFQLEDSAPLTAGVTDRPAAR